jgi:phosphate transport system permease protein
MNLSSRERINYLFKILFHFTGLLTLCILAGIFLMLMWNSIAFFIHSKSIDFFTDMQWSPENDQQAKYGILPLLISTGLVTAGAMIIAIPLGIGTAAFLAEYSTRKVRNILKSAIEMLAAIPSVAIGFLGIVIVGPGLAKLFGIQNGLNALNGSVLLAVMSLPTIITIAEDAIYAVPQSYREAAYAVGATKWHTLTGVTIPAAAPGIIAAIMLGIGRAIAETMTVLMATGNAAAIPKGFLDSIRTVTATIAIEMGEVPYKTTHYFALFAIASVLFLITLAVNLMGEHFAAQFRKYNFS